MRKVTFGGANSLDNYFARKDDAVDWLLWDEQVNSITTGFWKTIDTVVMGRRTYEVALRSGTASYPGVKNYVFEIGLNIHPLLLGAGIPLFHEMPHQIDLELLECKSFKNGCVHVSYHAKN